MIPKTFQLMAHTWTVRHCDGPVIAADGDKCKGLCDFDTLTISVDVTLPPSMVLHTFMHETMHAVLWSLGSDMCDNEGFVDSVGGCLTQIFWSMTGTEPAPPLDDASDRRSPPRLRDPTSETQPPHWLSDESLPTLGESSELQPLRPRYT